MRPAIIEHKKEAVGAPDPLGQKSIYATYLGGSQTETLPRGLLQGLLLDASGSATFWARPIRRIFLRLQARWSHNQR
jgi:hypothetical protein